MNYRASEPEEHDADWPCAAAAQQPDDARRAGGDAPETRRWRIVAIHAPGSDPATVATMRERVANYFAIADADDRIAFQKYFRNRNRRAAPTP